MQRTAVNTVRVGMVLGVLVSISSVGAMMGSVDWHIVGSLLAGSLPGIFVGSLVASHIAYDYATAASSIFTAFSGRAVS